MSHRADGKIINNLFLIRLAHYLGYTYCAISDHLMHAFCTGELCSKRVSIKL